jgi:adenylate cyclase
MSRLPFWSSLVALIAALAMLVFQPKFMAVLSNASFDAFQRLRPREYQAAPVRIIDIDEKSLQICLIL